MTQQKERTSAKAGARTAITLLWEGLTWNMPTQRQLLTFAAAFESLTGLALILAPKATAVFILGAEPNVVGSCALLGR